MLQILTPLMRAMAFLQMIEEFLRVYIGTAEQLIEAAVPYGVRFRVDRKSIENAPLGKLIRMFAKVNRNEARIACLHKLPAHRNYIAHVAFMRAAQTTTNKEIDIDYAKKHADQVGDEAELLLGLLGQELKSLMANFPNSKMANFALGTDDTAELVARVS